MSRVPPVAAGPKPEPDNDGNRTLDGRYVVVGGRRWRATDPSIPEPLKTELVAELMDARRQVGTAQRAGDDPSVAAARARVQDAKVALGERGRPWWEPAGEGDLRPRIEATIQALLVHRGPAQSICPSDVARSVGGASWRNQMDEVRTVARNLARRGHLRLTAGTTELDPEAPPRGPIRIRLAKQHGS